MSTFPARLAASSFLILLLAVAALFAESSTAAAISGSAVDSVGLFNFATGDGVRLEPSSRTCRGLVGDCIDEEEEMMMESEISRRGLRARAKYISYQALFKNKIPCNRRGSSYYNCNRGGAKKVNPYRRGCTYITHCARILN